MVFSEPFLWFTLPVASGLSATSLPSSQQPRAEQLDGGREEMWGSTGHAGWVLVRAWYAGYMPVFGAASRIDVDPILVVLVLSDFWKGCVFFFISESTVLPDIHQSLIIVHMFISLYKLFMVLTQVPSCWLNPHHIQWLRTSGHV